MSSRSSVVLRQPRRLGPLALAAAALATGGAGNVHAQSLYGGVDLGHPQYSSAVNGGGGSDGSNGGIGAKLYGGDTLTPNFALEGSLFRLGNTRSNGATVSTWGGAVDGVGSYAFAPQCSVASASQKHALTPAPVTTRARA